jgi:hypothetical protein
MEILAMGFTLTFHIHFKDPSSVQQRLNVKHDKKIHLKFFHTTLSLTNKQQLIQ